MAAEYSIIKQEKVASGYYVEYVVDETDDIETLPIQPQCSTGSRATVIENGDVYVLNTKGQWKLQPSSGGGGGGGDEAEIIRKAVAASVEKIVADAPPEYNTLEEIARWIENNTFEPYAQADISDLFD